MLQSAHFPSANWVPSMKQAFSSNSLTLLLPLVYVFQIRVSHPQKKRYFKVLSSFHLHPHWRFLFPTPIMGSNSVVNAGEPAYLTFQTLFQVKGRRCGKSDCDLLHTGQSRQSWHEHALLLHILENFARIIITWIETQHVLGSVQPFCTYWWMSLFMESAHALMSAVEL